MFTGIIRDIGTITGVHKHEGHWTLVIECNLDMDKIEIGASIACSGCCLTVIEKDGSRFLVDVSLESLDKTVIGSWGTQTKVNLEPSLKIGDEIGGHLVSGHVDGQASVKSIEEAGGSWKITITAPDHLARYIAPKGSVTLDGISLTVNEVDGADFTVNIIPHTWNVTTIGMHKEGDLVNIEIDQIARYVDRLMHADLKKAS